MAGFLFLALAVGFLLPVQTGVNAQLRASVGAPLAAALISFGVGTLALGAVTLAFRVPLPIVAAWMRSPAWIWTGGLLGAVYVAAMIVLAPRLGAATLVAAVVAGQMVASLVLDHFAWVGFPHQPVTPARLVGALLIVGGVVLVQR